MRTAYVALRLEDRATSHKIAVTAALLTCLLLTGLVTSAARGATIPGWGNSLSSGIAKAQAAGEPLVVVIATERCRACEQFAREASKSSSRRALSNIVKVRVEANQHPQLVRRYASRGTPTIIAFAPDTGYSSPIYNYTGVMTSSDLKRLAGSITPTEPVVSKANRGGSKAVKAKTKAEKRRTKRVKSTRSDTRRRQSPKVVANVSRKSSTAR